jgi:hypothetical protein
MFAKQSTMERNDLEGVVLFLLEANRPTSTIDRRDLDLNASPTNNTSLLELMVRVGDELDITARKPALLHPEEFSENLKMTLPQNLLAF